MQSANLIGAILEKARFDRADLSRARLSGANLVSASLDNACLAKADMEFALMASAVLRGACLQEADMSGAQLDAAVLTGADLARRTCVGPDFVVPGSMRPTSVMQNLVGQGTHIRFSCCWNTGRRW